MKVKQVYEKVICDNCHKEIEYGSEDAIQCTLRDERWGFLCANYFEQFDNENKFPF